MVFVYIIVGIKDINVRNYFYICRRIIMLIKSNNIKILVFLVLLFSPIQLVWSQNHNYQSEGEKVEVFDLIPLRQIDGRVLHIRGLNIDNVYYNETRDGYTIVLNNNGIYEYAKQTRNGDLVPGGVVANNPGNRDEREKKYLNRNEKHLRYKSPKLEELQNRNEIRMYRRVE